MKYSELLEWRLPTMRLGKKKEADDALKDFTERFQNDWSYLLAELYAYQWRKGQGFYVAGECI